MRKKNENERGNGARCRLVLRRILSKGRRDTFPREANPREAKSCRSCVEVGKARPRRPSLPVSGLESVQRQRERGWDAPWRPPRSLFTRCGKRQKSDRGWSGGVVEAIVRPPERSSVGVSDSGKHASSLQTGLEPGGIVTSARSSIGARSAIDRGRRPEMNVPV